MVLKTVIEDVSGCQHWTGTGEVEEYFEKEVEDEELYNEKDGRYPS